MGQTTRERWSALIERGPAAVPRPIRAARAPAYRRRWAVAPQPSLTDALVAVERGATTAEAVAAAVPCGRPGAVQALRHLASLGLVVYGPGQPCRSIR